MGSTSRALVCRPGIQRDRQSRSNEHPLRKIWFHSRYFPNCYRNYLPILNFGNVDNNLLRTKPAKLENIYEKGVSEVLLHDILNLDLFTRERDWISMMLLKLTRPILRAPFKGSKVQHLL